VTSAGPPGAVVDVVVRWAADALRALPPAEVPPRLKRVASFAPARLASRARAQLEQAVAGDAVFRQQVAERVRVDHPSLVDALEAAGPPPAGTRPDLVGAALWVLRPDGWEAGLAEAAASLAAQQADVARAQGERAEDTRWARLEQELADARAEAAEARGELAEARREMSRVRRELREVRAASGREEAQAREAAAAAEHDAVTRVAELAEARAELARLATALAAAEAAADAARARVREGRALADARVKLLLDTVADAALGLRRELGLPPVAVRPGDVVAATADLPGAVTGPGARARSTDDPARLDELLALPGAHLIVDGYNVTKSGYGELPLEQQRDRLVTGLAALAARTGAEVTCVFDGADAGGAAPALAARGMRVLFSRSGEIADELIRRLAAAEPPGRVVVVVSSDREVADGVARSGARPVAAPALLRLLGRG
jgi:predicted RNA-binding protein with PIN domain